jgi:hypothetical protein
MPVLKVWSGSAWVDAAGQSGTVSTATAPLVVAGANMSIPAATPSVPGHMTAAQATKLAGLGTPTNRLAYAPAVDHFNFTAIASGTWTDLHAAQNFTFGSTDSWLLFEIKLGLLGYAAANVQLGARALIDAIPIPYFSGVTYVGGYGVLNGSTFLFPPGMLAAGVHTFKTQVWGNANWNAYCRALTYPNPEFYSVRIVEYLP